MTIVGYLSSALSLVIIVAIILAYNKLVKRRNDVKNAFGSIDVMLKKRYDLIPNLIETVKTYMNYEKDTLTEITALRTRINTDLPADEKIEHYNSLQKNVDGLMMNVENYPDLKANQSFLDLQKSWNTSEEQISAARRFFNSAVTEYNNAIEVFPSNLIAGIFGFKKSKIFVITEEERKNISAKDLFEN